ncbi:MAG: hypothetical protein VXZ51_03855, partial [Actinomycetota bacterium]|nr:hypothetical protein [Actinomycetota bacterium]
MSLSFKELVKMVEEVSSKDYQKSDRIKTHASRRMSTKGKTNKVGKPYSQDPPTARAKSAPPGSGFTMEELYRLIDEALEEERKRKLRKEYATGVNPFDDDDDEEDDPTGYGAAAAAEEEWNEPEAEPPSDEPKGAKATGSERQERAFVENINKWASSERPISLRFENMVITDVIGAEKVEGLASHGQEPYTDVVVVTKSKRLNFSM